MTLRPDISRCLAMALFGAQGMWVWLMLIWNANLGVWGTAFVAMAAWLALWPVLHCGRGWRPWLEWLALAGVVYWPPLLLSLALDQLPRAPSRETMLNPLAMFYLLAAVAVMTVALSMIVAAPLRLARWRLVLAREADGPPPMSMRGVFALIGLAGVHLAAGQHLLRDMLTWDWDEAGKWVLTSVLFYEAIYALPTLLVVFAAILASFHFRAAWLLAVVAPLVSFGVIWQIANFLRPDGDDNALQAALYVAGLLANTALMSVALRLSGYRLPWRKKRGDCVIVAAAPSE